MPGHAEPHQLDQDLTATPVQIALTQAPRLLPIGCGAAAREGDLSAQDPPIRPVPQGHRPARRKVAEHPRLAKPGIGRTLVVVRASTWRWHRAKASRLRTPSYKTQPTSSM